MCSLYIFVNALEDAEHGILYNDYQTGRQGECEIESVVAQRDFRWKDFILVHDSSETAFSE